MKRKNRLIRYTGSDHAFLLFDWLILSAFALAVLYPLVFVVSASFSSAPMAMGLQILPAKFSTAGYEAVFNHKDVWSGYYNSIIYMVAGTLIHLVVTVMCAYPLSRRDFKARHVIMGLCVFTMYFGGGMIPSFLLIRNLKMIDTRWAVILPGALGVYNMIVLRTYFNTQIPGEIFESAQLDGCGNLRYLYRIVVPLSVPILAVLALFSAVGIWNAYFGAMIYLRSRDKFPLSMILREILVLANKEIEMVNIDAATFMAQQDRKNLMKYSLIIVSSVPVMLVYPFVQRYFVKGIMIGSVKG